MPLRIIRDDITRVGADAIVNTANPAPEIGGGTDYAIHTAAGPELLEARKKIGAIGVGQSAATPAFNLPAKYVLHTVSPVWFDGRHGEEEQLRASYDAALQLADQLGCESVAFPLLSAGTYGFPHDLALAAAIRAITDFLLDHEMQITLVLFNARAFGIAGSLFEDLQSYIDDRYVEERTEEEYRIDGALPSNASIHIRADKAPRRRPRPRPRDEAVFAASMPAEAAEPSPLKPLSLEEVLKQHEKTFSQHLLDLLRERDGKDSEVYRRAEVSKQLFSKILGNPDYRPTKNTAVQLAIGLELDLPKTQKLLETAGFALTRSSKADLVVQYFIERRIYSIPAINAALDDCGLPLLTTGLKA